MSNGVSPTAPAHREFVRRAAELQIPCWCFDAHLALTTDSPSDFGLAEVHGVAVAARQSSQATRQSISAELDLLALPSTAGVVVAELSRSETSSTGRDRLATILTHFHTDLTRAATDTMAIDGFNQQLSQSYEELNLVYRMAKLLTSSSEPCDVVQTMCDELRATLGYNWMAMRFDPGDCVLASLRGTALMAGDVPAAGAAWLSQTTSGGIGPNERVLTPAKHPLAAQIGSEVLAERVLHGDGPIGLVVAGGRQGADADVSSNEIQLVGATAGFLGLFHQNAFRFAEQRQQFLGTLHALSAAVDAKDPYTHGHSERVGLLASQLAAKLGHEPVHVEAIRVAGLLHDIGKIGVPEAVLCKPARLTDEEFTLIKMHPETGYEILKDLPSLAFHLPGVLHHHERWDGRGYPHKLSGEAIPMIARILALADTFDAMSSNRAYRSAMDRSRVLDEIRKSAGSQFDPQLVEPFITLDFTRFDQLLQERRSAETIV